MWPAVLVRASRANRAAPANDHDLPATTASPGRPMLVTVAARYVNIPAVTGRRTGPWRRLGMPGLSLNRRRGRLGPSGLVGVIGLDVRRPPLLVPARVAHPGPVPVLASGDHRRATDLGRMVATFTTAASTLRAEQAARAGRQLGARAYRARPRCLGGRRHPVRDVDLPLAQRPGRVKTEVGAVILV